MDFIALALTGKNPCKSGGCFDKVITMIVDIIVLLKREQLDDDNKKEYCTVQISRAEGKIEVLKKQKITAVTTVIEDHTAAIERLIEEIAKLRDGIKELDKTVADATDQRKAENAEYKELVASNTAAIELLGVAKVRLMKFYHKKESASSTSPGRTSRGTCSTEAPSAPPASFSKKTEESGGVIEMLGVLVGDLKTELHEAEMAEKEAQMAYER